MRRFQNETRDWMNQTFPREVTNDKLERCDRFLEEVFELLQACEYPTDRIQALQFYVENRPAGKVFAEVGGVINTLLAFCLAYQVDAQDAFETEMLRIWPMSDAIREKWEKKEKGSALPMTSTPRSTAAKMKPLHWRTFCSRTGNCEVKTPWGDYTAQLENGRWCVYKPGSDRRASEHDTLELAKAHIFDVYSTAVLGLLQ